MLVLTGVLVGVVLVVMIGGTALTFADLGWLATHATPFSVPEWMGSLVRDLPYWETLGAQVLAAVLVVGSYCAAEYGQGPAPARARRGPGHPCDSNPARRRRATGRLMALISGTDFICIPTRDYDAAAKFYGEVLGLRVREALGQACPRASSRPAT